jgi:hypothetical protein
MTLAYERIAEALMRHDEGRYAEWWDLTEERREHYLDAGVVAFDAALAAVDGMVPTDRIRGLVAMLYPDDMTPTAKRMFDLVCADYEAGEA